jgi:hypothetical protein
MRSFRVFAVGMMFALSWTAQANDVHDSLGRNPEGEVAFYKLDKKTSGRTSSLVTQGQLKWVVGGFAADIGKFGSWVAKLDYNLKVLIAAPQIGQRTIRIPADYIAYDYFDKLKLTKTIQEEHFKLEYQGQETVTKLDGKEYTDCAKVLAYDIDIDAFAKVKTVMMKAFGIRPTDSHLIKDVTLLLTIKNSVPVVNAVKLDLMATVRGIKTRAGFDYMPVESFVQLPDDVPSKGHKKPNG